MIKECSKKHFGQVKSSKKFAILSPRESPRSTLSASRPGSSHNRHFQLQSLILFHRPPTDSKQMRFTLKTIEYITKVWMERSLFERSRNF